MKLGVTLDILNQKDTPAFYADTLANRPAAGFTGRVFISTDTLDLYRDTGTTWVLLSPSSTGTITGSGAAGQVTFFSSASSITGTNDLFYDSGNNRLGINTNAPTAPLDVHSSLSGALLQLNQTSGTSDSQLAFQSANVGKWRIGSYYNAGQYSFGIYDVFNSRERFSVLNTGQTFVGDQVSSSGKLVVNSGSLGDTGLVVISSSSPSIRINNGGTGANFRCGLGISTAANNFIQGSVDGDFCIFNSNTGTYPILFGINDTGLGNTQEAARVSAARNFLIGTTTDSGYKLNVNGTSYFVGGLTFVDRFNSLNGSPNRFYRADNAAYTEIYDAGSLAANGFTFNNTNGEGFHFKNGATTIMRMPSNNNVGIGNTTPSYKLDVTGTIASNTGFLISSGQYNNITGVPYTGIYMTDSSSSDGFGSLLISSRTDAARPIIFGTSSGSTSAERMRIVGSTGNVLIGTTTDTGDKLQVAGTITNYRNYTENTTNGVTQNAIRANAVNSQGAFTWLTYGRGIVATGTGTKLNIPFTSQTNINLVTIARVTICSADFNSAFGGTAQFTFSVGSLNALSNLSILQSGGGYVSATTSGMNVVITLGGYTAAYVYIEYLTPYPAYSIDLGNITLTS
jgi:hypothetical protein